jgi:hypothetical protein
MIKKAAWFMFFGMLASACLDEPDCYSLNNNLVGVSFERMSTSRADTLVFTKISADGTDVQWKSIIGKSGTFVNLPLDYFKNETTFHFEADDETFDLKLGYSAKAQFVSKECGERFVLTNLIPISHNFDSVRVVNSIPKAGNTLEAQLEVYRCPNTSQIKIRFITTLTVSMVDLDYPHPKMTYGSNVVLVPLDVNASVASMHFTFSNGTGGDLTLKYTRQTQTLFNACGEQIVISDLTVDTTTFAPFKMIRKSIQDPPLTNLEIFL